MFIPTQSKLILIQMGTLTCQLHVSACTWTIFRHVKCIGIPEDGLKMT